MAGGGHKPGARPAQARRTLRPMRPSALAAFLVLAPTLAPSGPGPARAEERAPPAPHLAAYGAGEGPRAEGRTLHLLDAQGTPGQSNAAGYDLAFPGAREWFGLRARVRVAPGGDGGSVLFLATRAFGRRGPAPFLPSAVEPNLAGTFAVGLDVHNPPSQEPFTPWGNYQDLPQREVSLHLDGRELVKRVAPVEFRGVPADLEVRVQHVTGGAEVTVALAGAKVYDRHFVPGLLPYEWRLGFAAGTRPDAATHFEVHDPVLDAGPEAAPLRPPLGVAVFDHVLTDNRTTAYAREVDLPPASWAFGRVLLTLSIHDAGEAWDEWDRNGEVSVKDDDGRTLGIVPFITSYRTECHWVVDVTPFRPLLAGRRTIELAAGTTFYKNRGYRMSLALEYHHGAPALEPFAVVPLWHGTAHYRSQENHFRDFFGPREVAVPRQTRAARLFVTTTGHSQVGEFTPSRRTIVFTPDTAAPEAASIAFDNVLWRTDVYLNPNRPQFGTWHFARAGWAPGDVVRPWWIDLTAHFVPGVTARLEYHPQPYEFPDQQPRPTPEQVAEATHVVRAYLILYREAAELVPAPVLRVTNVEGGSNAARAGIQAGDYLAEYDGRRLDSVEDLRAAIAQAGAKPEVPAVTYRGAERRAVVLAPGRLGVGLSSR